MSKRLLKAVHDLNNTLQLVVSAIEQEEFELALKAARKANKQMESICEQISILKLESAHSEG